MILAEKIIQLSKQNGWSQEELAMRIGVSRQSVSKWESMSSLPDLDKIIKLSEIFGVSIDYLLKDDMDEEPGYEPDVKESIKNEDKESIVEVTLEEANRYMKLVEKASVRIAAGVAACILSPVCVILLAGFSDTGAISMNEDLMGGIGSAVLLIMIACAVMIFVSYGIQLSKFEYLEKEVLSLQYGIAGIVEAKQEAHEPKFKNSIASGVALCILSVVPLLIAAGFNLSDDVYISLTAVLFVFVACGVFLFVKEGMIHSCYQKLLEEGDYSVEKKRSSKKNDAITTIYWCVVVALFLGVSFVKMAWDRTWIIWPVAAVLYVAVIAVADSIRKK